MEELQGTLENVIYQSDDGGFCVLRVKTAAGLVTVTYKGMAPYMGENTGASTRVLGGSLRLKACALLSPARRTALNAFWQAAR